MKNGLFIPICMSVLGVSTFLDQGNIDALLDFDLRMWLILVAFTGSWINYYFEKKRATKEIKK